MSKQSKSLSIAITLVLFVLLVFLGGMLFSAISKDVDLREFTAITPEGNLYITDSDGFKIVSYRWYFDGLHTITLPIPEKEYTFYESKPRSFAREYGYYIQDNSSILNNLAKELLSVAAINSYSDTETVSFIASFIQSLEGTSDYYDDYPQFSLETLYLGTGDCEDMAILGSRVLSSAGYDVILVELDDHVGIGVSVNASGSSFEFENDTYYYTELTGVDYEIGELPSEYASITPSLYDPSYVVLNPSWDITKITVNNESWYNVSVTLENDFTGDVFGYVDYKNSSSDIEVLTLKEERLVTMMLPVLPSLDHRLMLEFRGVSVNTVYLQTAWVTEY